MFLRAEEVVPLLAERFQDLSLKIQSNWRMKDRAMNEVYLLRQASKLLRSALGIMRGIITQSIETFGAQRK
jgi:asparagine synthetase B (glutamine-hydrolysing)